MQKNVTESANSCGVVCLGGQRESAELLSLQFCGMGQTKNNIKPLLVGQYARDSDELIK